MFRGRMRANELLDRCSSAVGKTLEIGAAGSAVDGRQCDETRLRADSARLDTSQQVLGGAMVENLRIEQHEQRARSGDRVEEAGRRVGRQRRSDGDCLAVGVGVACPRPFEEHGPVDDVPQRARHCAVVADSSFACKRPRPAPNPERPLPLDSLVQSW